MRRWWRQRSSGWTWSSVDVGYDGARSERNRVCTGGGRPMTTPHYADFALYRRLARQARIAWRSIAALFLVGLLATPLALLTPLPLKIAVDSVLGARPLPPFL